MPRNWKLGASSRQGVNNKEKSAALDWSKTPQPDSPSRSRRTLDENCAQAHSLNLEQRHELMTRPTMEGSVSEIAACALAFLILSCSTRTVPPSAMRATGDPEASARVSELLTQTLPEMGSKQVKVITVEYPPNAASPPHLHPGQVFAYVLEGSIVSQVGSGPELTYAQGQIFHEPPLSVHSVSRNASQTRPAKLLVFIIKDPDQPDTVPAK